MRHHTEVGVYCNHYSKVGDHLGATASLCGMNTQNFDVTVGIDPSLTSTGIAVHWPGRLNDTDIITHRIRSAGKKADSWDTRNARINKIAGEVIDVIPNNALVVMESPSYGSVSTSAHDRSGLWWAIYSRLIQAGCTVVPAAPSQRMMYATGKGGGKDAGKDNVLAQAIKRYPQINITGNDVADAVIFLAMGMRLNGKPLEESLPLTHLNAMNKLCLPAQLAMV